MLDFTVRRSISRRVDVVEAPEMPELPPVRGTITATVNFVENPNIPDPVATLPDVRVLDAATKDHLKELAANYVRRQYVSACATVYDHKRTLIRWSFFGNDRGGLNGKKEFLAWSNVDFSHFTNFSSYQVAQSDGSLRKYELMMFAVGYDTGGMLKRSERLGLPYTPPKIPEIPELAIAGPKYVMIGGEDSDSRALAFISGLHDLYQVEGERLEVAFQARLKAHEERKAYLLANPPVPEDVTVNFWKRIAQSEAPTEMKGETP